MLIRANTVPLGPEAIKTNHSQWGAKQTKYGLLKSCFTAISQRLYAAAHFTAGDVELHTKQEKVLVRERIP